MQTIRKHRLILGTVAAVTCYTAVLTGCDGRVSKVAVSGSVTYDGEPIADGQVAFEPRGEGRMEFGIITDGKYSIPQEFGLVPGTYLIRITGNRPTGQMAKLDSFVTDDRSREIFEQFLPAKYNAASQLEVEIPAESHVTQDFQLEKSS